MKKFFVLAIAAIVSATAVAQDSVPFGPELRSELNKISRDSSDGEKVLKVARATYDVAVNGGATGTAYNLGVYLPKNAVLVQSWFHVVTQFAGTGTVALSCEDANNIYTAAQLSGSAAGDIVKGRQTGGTDSMTVGISDKCALTATVGPDGGGGGATLTAGKLILFVKYLVAE